MNFNRKLAHSKLIQILSNLLKPSQCFNRFLNIESNNKTKNNSRSLMSFVRIKEVNKFSRVCDKNKLKILK